MNYCGRYYRTALNRLLKLINGYPFDEETKRQFESLVPRGKMGRPEEIATVALFLASDDSSYVNGMELVADGGTTAI